LKRALEKSRSNDPNYAEYASLDPENKHWDSFEKRLYPICTRKTDADGIPMDDGLASLEEKLVDALQLNGAAGLQRALHFAFIDHVIASRAIIDDGKLRQYADLRYPTEWYPVARQLQREIHLHVGPTNSGKTYNALKNLEESGNGFYAGPLRLLAHEVYSRFRAKGVACDLRTGDDVRIDESGNAKLTSSTVEMVDVMKPVDVAVIDEIQMMAQDERGWAWTRAFLGATAKEVHLCGETRVVPLIRELAASMGDTLHIHQYERLNPLKAMSKSLRGNLKNLRKGDCIVSFSVLGIHAMKKQIEVDTGRRVAIVYGGLPPETRAQQAALFNDPDNDYDFLVASDAIGMGLNLSIKRIIFESIWKRGNHGREKLSISALKQIAGRAGRYRTANQDVNKQESKSASDGQNARLGEYRATATVGLVTCLDEEDLRYIQVALRTEPEPIKHAAILPPAEFVDDFASHLPSGIPFEYILNRLNELSVLHSRYKLCDIKDQLSIARALEPVKELSIVSRYILAAAPADTKTPTMQRVLQAYGKCVAEMKMVAVADIEEVPLEVLEKPVTSDRNYLLGLELLHKALVLYLWLSYRFVNVFKDREMAMYAKSMCEEKINRCLLEVSANPALRARLQKMEKTGSAKAEDANDEVDSVVDGPTSKDNLGAEEELLDQSFATGENIDQPAEFPEETVARSPLSPQESTNQPTLPVAWDNAGSLAEGAPQQDNEGPRYASAHG
jgi:ATP-dependent RNA helicase SUPV3L1/SUV3